MSGATTLPIRVSIEGSQTVERAFDRIAQVGERAMERIESSSRQAGTTLKSIPTADVERNTSRLGTVFGQAGYQVQDFATQVSMGQNAVVAFSTQASQLLGIFGTGGAIAGAVLTVGTLVYQLLAGKDAAKEFADTIRNVGNGYRTAMDDAEQWRAGLDKEAEKALSLRRYYDSLSESRRSFEQAALTREEKALNEQREALRRQIVGNLGGLSQGATDTLAQMEMQARANYGAASAEYSTIMSDETVARIRQVVAAIEDFRNSGKFGSEELANFSTRLTTLSDGMGPLGRLIRANAESMIDSASQTRDLEAASRQLDERFRALGLRVGEVGNQLEMARGRLLALATIALDNPTASIDRQLEQTEARIAALRSGGVTGLDRLTAQQEAESKALETASRWRTEYAATLRASGMAETMIAAQLERDYPAALQRSRALAQAEQQLADSRKRAQDAAKASPTEGADVSGLLDQIRDKQEQAARSLEASLDPAVAAVQKYQDALAKLNDAVTLFESSQGRMGLSAERAAELGGSALNNYKKEMERLNKSSEQSSQLADKFSDAIGQAFMSASMTGSSLTDVFKTLEQAIAKAIIQVLILQPLIAALKSAMGSAWNSFFGGETKDGAGSGGTIGTVEAIPSANGNIMTSAGPLPLPLQKYATGGIARSPQLSLFGEGRTPEAYVPLPDGRSIPVSMKGGGSTSMNQSLYIDARGADRSGMLMLQAMIPSIIKSANAELVSSVNRGGADAKTFGRRK